MGYNQLQYIPRKIGLLTKLESLCLDHNQLQAIPYEIEQLTNLYSLYLNHNQLQFIPQEIISLHLQTQNLHNNPIDSENIE